MMYTIPANAFQPMRIDMCERNQATRKEDDEAEFESALPKKTPPPPGMSRLGRKIWEALDTPDFELQKKVSAIFDETFFPDRPRKKDCVETQKTPEKTL